MSVVLRLSSNLEARLLRRFHVVMPVSGLFVPFQARYVEALRREMADLNRPTHK